MKEHRKGNIDKTQMDLPTRGSIERAGSGPENIPEMARTRTICAGLEKRYMLLDWRERRVY